MIMYAVLSNYNSLLKPPLSPPHHNRNKLALHVFLPSSQDNICISNAQYASFSALRNLWCEILEF